MGEVRDPAALLGVRERPAAVPGLEGKPDAEVDPGREAEEEDGRDPGEHLRPWVEDDVRAEDARDRAARPDVRDGRLRGRAVLERDERLQGVRGEAGGGVEDEEADTPEGVLDVV